MSALEIDVREAVENASAGPAGDVYRRAVLEFTREFQQVRNSDSFEALSRHALSQPDPSLLAEVFIAGWVRTSIAPSKKAMLRVKGAIAFAELLKSHGGTYSAADVAQLLQISPDAVRKRGDRLLAVTMGEHRRYPVWQFTDGGLLPGFEDVLNALKSSGEVAKVRFFLSPVPELGNRSPLDALHDLASRPLVLRLAEQFGEQGAQ